MAWITDGFGTIGSMLDQNEGLITSSNAEWMAIHEEDPGRGSEAKMELQKGIARLATERSELYDILVEHDCETIAWSVNRNRRPFGL